MVSFIQRGKTSGLPVNNYYTNYFTGIARFDPSFYATNKGLDAVERNKVGIPLRFRETYRIPLPDLHALGPDIQLSSSGETVARFHEDPEVSGTAYVLGLS